MPKLEISVFISGRGSNLKAILEHQTNYVVSSVFSNKENAHGLNYAKEYNIPYHIFDRINFPDLKSAKSAMLDKVCELNPDLIVLAGFMQIIDPKMIEKFPRRIINIHPSLLPDYPGLDTHQRVLADKKTTHGCTVHLVDNGLDTGDTIAQAQIDITGITSPELVAQKLLPIEHKIYPWVINGIADHSIKLNPTVTKLREFSYEA